MNIAIDLDSRHRSAFDLWHETWPACLEDVAIDAPDRLVHGWGPSLIEHAVIDAACRAAAESLSKHKSRLSLESVNYLSYAAKERLLNHL